MHPGDLGHGRRDDDDGGEQDGRLLDVEHGAAEQAADQRGRPFGIAAVVLEGREKQDDGEEVEEQFHGAGL